MRKLFLPDIPFSPQKTPFFYGWVILFASSLGIVASIPGQTMGFSVFTDILVKELQLSSSSISAAYLVGTICAGLFLPKIGKLFDQTGARFLATIICVIMGVGLIYLSQVDRIAHGIQSLFTFLPSSAIAFISIGFGFFWLRFTGQGALTMTSRSMLGKWFNYKRGIALSISGVVVSFSFSLAPRVLDLFIQSAGWRWTWAGLGLFMITGACLFVWLLYRDNPEECGLTMDGKEPDQQKKNTNKDLTIHREFNREEALRTYSFWIFNLILGLHSFTITGYTFHVVSIAKEVGLDREIILQAFIPASIIGIVISLIGGVINPHIRLKYLLALLPLGGAIFTLGPALELQQTPLLIIIGMGICGGTFGLVSGLVWPRFFGRKHLGAISGVGMATMVYASAIAPLAFSLCNDIWSRYSGIFLVLTVIYAAFFILSFFADNPQRKI